MDPKRGNPKAVVVLAVILLIGGGVVGVLIPALRGEPGALYSSDSAASAVSLDDGSGRSD